MNLNGNTDGNVGSIVSDSYLRLPLRVYVPGEGWGKEHDVAQALPLDPLLKGKGRNGENKSIKQ